LQATAGHMLFPVTHAMMKVTI